MTVESAPSVHPRESRLTKSNVSALATNLDSAVDF